MILSTENGNHIMAVGGIPNGIAINTIRFDHIDVRKLLLLGPRTLDRYFRETLFTRFAGNEPEGEVMGFRAHLTDRHIDFTAGDRGLPDDVMELEVGRWAFDWLCGLDMYHGSGTLENLLRQEVLPKLHKID